MPAHPNPDGSIELTCLQCGARLQVADDIERCACRACGTEFVVRRGGGLVALQRVSANASRATREQQPVAQERVTRLQREIVAEEAAITRLLETHQAELQALEARSPVKGLFLLALALVAIAVALATRGEIALFALALIVGLTAGWLVIYAMRSLKSLSAERQHLTMRFDQTIAVRKAQREALDDALQQALAEASGRN